MADAASRRRAIDLPVRARVARLVTRRDVGGPEHVWFDPFGPSSVWAAPTWRLETLGRTPRAELGPLAVPGDAPWLVLPAMGRDDPWRDVLRLPPDVPGLAVAGADEGLAPALRRLDLRALVVAGRGRLDRAAVAAIAAQRRLEQLVVLVPVDDAALAAFAGLDGLRLLALGRADVTARGLARLAALPRLELLDLGGAAADDAALAALAGGPIATLDASGAVPGPSGAGLAGWAALRDLSLGTVEADGLRAVAALAGLEHLDLRAGADLPGGLLDGLGALTSLGLRGAALDDLAPLARLPRLRRLALGGAWLRGPAALAPLSALPDLVELGLPDAGLEDEALAPLAALTGLRALDLKSAAVTGAGFAALRGLARLERLSLFNCIRVTAEGLAEVARLPGLRQVNLGSCAFPFEDAPTGGLTDAGLRALAACPTLARVDARGNHVSAAAVRALREARPGCRVVASGLVPTAVVEATEAAEEAVDVEDLDAAEAALDEARRLGPDVARVHLVAARVLEARGDLDAARAAVDRAVALDPDAEPLALRGHLRARAGLHAQAAADFERALAVDPTRAELLLWRAEARFAAGDLAGAHADHTALVARCARGDEDGDDAVWFAHAGGVFTNRGCEAEGLGRLAEAEADHDRAVGVDPTDAFALENRAEARLKLGRAAEALADARAALALDPTLAGAPEVAEAAARALGEG